VFFVAAVLAVAFAIWQPDAAIAFGQAAVLGLGLVVVAHLLRHAFRRRQRAGILAPNPISSVSDRSGAKSKPRLPELVGTASTASMPDQFEASSSIGAGD
jgi:hypothetical protein